MKKISGIMQLFYGDKRNVCPFSPFGRHNILFSCPYTVLSQDNTSKSKDSSSKSLDYTPKSVDNTPLWGKNIPFGIEKGVIEKDVTRLCGGHKQI
jgi:hypothetical protein